MLSIKNVDEVYNFIKDKNIEDIKDLLKFDVRCGFEFLMQVKPSLRNGVDRIIEISIYTKKHRYKIKATDNLKLYKLTVDGSSVQDPYLKEFGERILKLSVMVPLLRKEKGTILPEWSKDFTKPNVSVPKVVTKYTVADIKKMSDEDYCSVFGPKPNTLQPEMDPATFEEKEGFTISKGYWLKTVNGWKPMACKYRPCKYKNRRSIIKEEEQ